MAEPARAQAALDEALRIGQPEGYLRTFVNAGEPMRQALKSWIEHHDPKDSAPLYAYAQRVLAAFDAPALEKPSHEPQPADLPEPLSQREMEVLQLVARGLTNQQIADRLVISIRTVKKHVENIDGKLGAQNRTQAVDRARAAGPAEQRLTPTFLTPCFSLKYALRTLRIRPPEGYSILKNKNRSSK